MRKRQALAIAFAASAAAAAHTAAAAAAAPEAVGCGAVVTQNVTLHADLGPCPGDGLVVGANGVRINLNGFTIWGTKAAGSVGIRVVGHDDVKIVGGQFASINEFGTGVLARNADRLSVVDIDTRTVIFGIRLQQSDHATLKQNDVGFFEGGFPGLDCATNTAPAGILLYESSYATVRDNFGQLTNFGILLVRAHHNTLRSNGAAPDFSDGNVCNGITLVDSDDNTLIANTTAQNRSGYAGGGDGIFVDADSKGTVLRRNVSLANTDDGIDIESKATKLFDNRADDNDDLNPATSDTYGIESVPGVTASGNTASGNNGGGVQCLNVACA
jgi:parallel beta-helix repeat protein